MTIDQIRRVTQCVKPIYPMAYWIYTTHPIKVCKVKKAFVPACPGGLQSFVVTGIFWDMAAVPVQLPH